MSDWLYITSFTYPVLHIHFRATLQLSELVPSSGIILEVSRPCSVNSSLFMVLGGFCKVTSYLGSLVVVSAVKLLLKYLLVFKGASRRGIYQPSSISWLNSKCFYSWQKRSPHPYKKYGFLTIKDNVVRNHGKSFKVARFLQIHCWN